MGPDWNRHETAVKKRFRKLVRRQERLAARGRRKDRQEVLGERIRRLKIIISTLDFLKQDSPYCYVIRRIPSDQGAGATVYEPRDRAIAFGIQDSGNNTYSFVHEVTHGLQFARGEIVFDMISGYSVGDDIGDELEAYKNQFAYDDGSVSGIRSFGQMDSAWLRSLKNRDGVFLYSPDSTGKYNVIGLETVTVDSDTNTLRKAYPAIKAWKYFLYPLRDSTRFIFREKKDVYSIVGSRMHEARSTER
jgi:hypothetical protein